MLKKLSLIILSCVISCYLAFCLAVYFYPQGFFYNPSSQRANLANALSNGFKAEEVTYNSSDGTELYGWFVKPQSKKKVIVYFHGNSHNIEAFYHKLIPLIDAGYGVFIGEYRGFGGIKGIINQNNLGNDALAAVHYLHSQGYENTDLILYGMSMGSYTSIHTAYELGKEQSFSALILEVPFDSILNVVKQRIVPLFPFELIIKDKYDNITKIAKLNLPILIMGGSKDKVVPIECAQNLYNFANINKKMIVYKGADHSELYSRRNWQDILDWLNNNEKIK